MRRTLLLLAAIATSFVPAASPNIVLVFIDDMGWSDFSAFGNEAVETQHIDRLASEGIRFEQFYVNSPICSPSRTAISTGQYPQRWRIGSYLAARELNEKRGVAQWLDPKAPMLARILHDAGVLYVPDWMVSAGGAIHGVMEFLGGEEFEPKRALARIHRVCGWQVDEILSESRLRGHPPFELARNRYLARLAPSANAVG